MPDSPNETSSAQDWLDSLGYDEQIHLTSGKRCGMAWTPWMGDFFTSYSPRNSNSHAEGPWDHWIDLALAILADPLTAVVRPEAHDPALKDKIQNFYDESRRSLTPEELEQHFRRATED